MKTPEDFFHWLVISPVRPPRQILNVFVSSVIRSYVKKEEIGKCIVRVLLVAALTGSPTGGSATDLPREQHFDIPQQPVDKALDTLATQANVFLLFPYDQVREVLEVNANPINGMYSIQDALVIMLKNTGLTGALTDSGVITISRNDLNQNGKGKEKMNIKSKKSLLATLIAFFATGAVTQGVMAQDDADNEKAAAQQTQIEEIIVTATKRESTLQETAIALSLLTEDTIDKRGLVDMNDYLATVPGASFIEYSATDKKIILRGLSVGPRDPQGTASAYLGEIPVSSALAAFDVALVDIERIEVLKGPQGTLFGSNSLGGLIRTIPMAPNLSEMGGSLKGDFSTQDESDDNNHSLTAAVNIPLIEDQLALRVAAYQIKEAGYIDIVSSPSEDAIAAATGATAIVKDDSNSSTNEGVRASLLWQPTEDLKVSAIYGVQKNDVDDISQLLTSLPGYQTSYLNTPATATTDLEYSNLVIEYDLGWATLLSSSSLLNNENDYLVNSFPLHQNAFFGPTQTGAVQDTNLKTQEIRLVSHLNGQWEYLAGVFYEKAELRGITLIDWIGNLTANPFGAERLLDLATDLNYEHKALFGEISYQFNEQWLLTLGGRHFQYDRVDTNTFIGNALFNGADTPPEDISESDNIYKANLAFTPNENTLIYAQWSEGFRLGRGQALPSSALCDVNNDGILDGTTDGRLTPRVESDTTANVELGLKLSLLDNRLVVNTAVFKTDWDNLPTAIRSTGTGTCFANTEVINNIGSAQSQGIEVDATYLLDAWQFSLSASYMDTERTNTRPPVVEGERLVYAPRTNAIAGLQYNFMFNGYSGFIRTDIGYVGDYPSAESFFSLPSSGDYVDTSLHVGMTINQWALTFYGTNLTGNDDIRTNAGAIGDNTIGIRAMPRRLGVKVSYDF